MDKERGKVLTGRLPLNMGAPTPEMDGMDVPALMLELFLNTLDEDLTALKAARTLRDRDQIVGLLHRIRGALAVGQAKSLVALCSEVETAVSSESCDLHSTGLGPFIERVERAIGAISK